MQTSFMIGLLVLLFVFESLAMTKAIDPYKIGDKTDNFMVKTLNLNKIEGIANDAISDQEFSEDECRRLRQEYKIRAC